MLRLVDIACLYVWFYLIFLVKRAPKKPEFVDNSLDVVYEPMLDAKIFSSLI